MAGKDPDFARIGAQSGFSEPAFFLYGSDDGLVSSALSDLVARAQKKRPDLGPVERKTAADLSAEPALLLDFFDERPLFGDHRFLVVSELGERQAKLLLSLFEQPDPAPGPLLMLASHSFKTRAKTLEAARSCVFCTVVSAYEAPFSRADAEYALAAAGVTSLDADALAMAHRHLATLDPASRRMGVEQLALYANAGALAADDVAACLPATGDLDASDLLDALLSASAPRLLAWRRRGAAEGADPIQQLAALARSLADARRALSPVGPPAFWRVDKLVKAAARTLPRLDARIESALVAAHHEELAARKGGALAAERLERLLLRLSQIFQAR